MDLGRIGILSHQLVKVALGCGWVASSGVEDGSSDLSYQLALGGWNFGWE